MSGFAVLLRGANEPSPQVLTGLAADIVARGPDRQSVLDCGPTFLAHAQFCTTPESQAERFPLRHTERPIWLVADARVDNGAELRAALGGSPDRLLTDADLILGAYCKWGERLVEHLYGDFAFAIWDEELQTLFVGRDHFGIRPVYWTELPDGGRVVGSTLRSVVRARQEVLAYDDDYLVRFARAMDCDPEATPHRFVRRLPGGHVMTMAAGRPTSSRRYWVLDVPHRSVSVDEAAAEVRRLFEASVRHRLRAPGRVAIQLSGGFDSTSVAAVAAQLVDAKQLLAVGVEFPGLPCDEGHYIRDAAHHIGIELRTIDAKQAPEYDFVEEIAASMDLPSTPDSRWYVPLDRLAASSGCRVVLDGQGGDHLLHGSMQAAAAGLIARGHVIRAGHLLRHAGYRARDVPRFLVRQLAGAFVHVLSKSSRVALYRARWRRQPQTTEFVTRPASMVPTDVPFRMRGRWGRSRGMRANHYLGHLCWFEDLWDRLGPASGVEARHPYLDVRLVEYVLSLSEEILVADRRLRGLHRRVLGQSLPVATLNRTDKAVFNDSWVLAGLSLTRKLTGVPHSVHLPFIDVEALERAGVRAAEAPSSVGPIWEWWCAWSVHAWANAQHGLRPFGGDSQGEI